MSIKTPFDPTNTQLDKLAEFMTRNTNNDNSSTPAGYTYLSQFIDHDIALDSMSGVLPWNVTVKPQTINNNRTPFFDLETIYGVDDSPNPNMVTRSELMENKSRLKVGWTMPDGEKRIFPNDLPRYPDRAKAWIVDERNDENLAVAQTQVAFIKFHNAIVSRLGGADTKELFEEARRIAILHYQWIILHDFLPRIIKKSVLDDVLNYGNKFYRPAADDTFMPLEFSGGAYRMGHSMVRNMYQWNRIFSDPDPNYIQHRAIIHDLIKFTGSSCSKGFQCMDKKKNLPSDWIINWNWFYDIDNSMSKERERFNFASKINTYISKLLGMLSAATVTGFYRIYSLPAFDLYRARVMSLPTGQAVAAKILNETTTPILQPQQIAPLLPEELKKEFSIRTPIWFYLLAEAQLNKNEHNKYCETLGEVGSRVVAETFVELLKRSKPSIFDMDFSNSSDFLGKNGRFGMPEMLKFVESKEPGFLNPIARN